MCRDIYCPNNVSGYCQVTACTRHTISGSISSNILINSDVIIEYKKELKKNLKDLFKQPGIITEHAVFDVIDRTCNTIYR